jgi:hypothetical protein
MRRAKNPLGSKERTGFRSQNSSYATYNAANAKYIQHRCETHVALRTHYTTILGNPSSVSLSAQAGDLIGRFFLFVFA